MGEARPVRLQLSRRKGFNLQALSMATNGLPAVNVARPSKWGNPFVVGDDVPGMEGTPMDAEDARDYFRIFTVDKLDLAPLAGKNLACFCKPGDPCHADVLLELANAGDGK